MGTCPARLRSQATGIVARLGRVTRQSWWHATEIGASQRRLWLVQATGASPSAATHPNCAAATTSRMTVSTDPASGNDRPHDGSRSLIRSPIAHSFCLCVPSSPIALTAEQALTDSTGCVGEVTSFLPSSPAGKEDQPHHTRGGTAAPGRTFWQRSLAVGNGRDRRGLSRGVRYTGGESSRWCGGR